MVGDEAGGADDDRGVFVGELADDLLDGRPEPRIRGASRALPSDHVIDASELGGDELRRLAQAVDVGA